MTQVLPKERAREYESIFILHPDSQTKVIDSVAGKCQDIISELNGKLLRAENWGRRRLAYPVKKNAKGIYIYLRYLGYQDLVHELERNFRTMDSIIKFLTVKIDEDVDPDSRPVAASDISFVSTFEETSSKPEAAAEETAEETVAEETVAEEPAAEETAAEEPAAEEPAAEETAEEAENENSTDDSDAAQDEKE